MANPASPGECRISQDACLLILRRVGSWRHPFSRLAVKSRCKEAGIADASRSPSPLWHRLWRGDPSRRKISPSRTDVPSPPASLAALDDGHISFRSAFIRPVPLKRIRRLRRSNALFRFSDASKRSVLKISRVSTPGFREKCRKAPALTAVPVDKGALNSGSPFSV